MKVYVVVEVWGLIVQGVHIFKTWREVEEWGKRELADDPEYLKWFLEGKGEPPWGSHWDETKVFVVET